MRNLIVSLDAFAALREVAGDGSADLGAAATLARLAGASAVRIGVSEELQPVTELDLRDLRRAARGFELRMAPVPSLLKLALEARPDRVLLAAEPREGLGPLPIDFHAWGTALAPVIRTLEEAGIDVALRVAPDLEAVKAAHAAEARAIELWTRPLADLPDRERREALGSLSDVTRLAAKLRMRVGLGGSLSDDVLPTFLEAAPVAEWIATGRSWVSGCALQGIDRVTRDWISRVG